MKRNVSKIQAIRNDYSSIPMTITSISDSLEKIGSDDIDMDCPELPLEKGVSSKLQ